MPDPAKPDEKPRERPRQRRYKGASAGPLSGCTPYALALLAVMVLLVGCKFPHFRVERPHIVGRPKTRLAALEA